MHRFAATLATLAIFAMTAMQAVAADREIALETPTGTLTGTFYEPAQPSGAAVLIHPGSGPTDGDGNGPGMVNDSLKRLAHELGASGIASLRIDKRGIARSRAAGPAREDDLRFTDYVADAAAWAAHLKAQPGVTRVFLLGHSEGAHILSLAAAQAEAEGVIALAGAGRPPAGVIREQLRAAGLPPALLARAERALDALAGGARVEDPPAELAALFRPSVQPYLISWFAAPDPAAALAAAPGRALIVSGGRDIQVGMADADALAAARRDAVRVDLPAMNHILREAPADRAGNIATYTQPELPLAPGLTPAIANFVLAAP